MDSGSERSPRESVEDNGEFKIGIVGESALHDNGSCDVENNDIDSRIPADVKGKGAQVSGQSNSLPDMETTPQVSPSSSSTKKGFGLKKWKRIKRDVNRSGSNIVDSGKMSIQEPAESIVHHSKRTQTYKDRPQKSEGSVSSVTPLVGGMDFFAMLNDAGLSINPSIDAGADSENSEDQSSKSSTAASIPKVRYDMGKIGSSSGKNLTHSPQGGQQGKVQSELIKKARGEHVNIKEGNSLSSLESDSHSSNFVFMQGVYATSNGLQSDMPIHHARESADEGNYSEHQVSEGLQASYRSGDGGGGYRDISPEDGSADSNCKVKAERSENGSSSDQDPLVESLVALQSAQEALEKEVLMIKEINSATSVDELVSDTQPEMGDVGLKVQETSSGQFPFGVGIETTKEYVLAELEDLFERKIAAEVEYLTILRTIQNLRVAAVNQTTNVRDQKLSASEQGQILKNRSDTVNEDANLKTEAEKLENFNEDLASADETLKLQKRLCKRTSFFFIQLICLLIFLGVFMSRLSPDYAGVVPT